MSEKVKHLALTILRSVLRFRAGDKRQLLGMVTISLFVLVGVIWTGQLVAASMTSLAGPLLRAALVLGALWLAWPQLTRIITRIPQWLGVGLGAILLVGIVRPQFLYVVIPLSLALWFLGPMLMRRLDQRPTVPGAKRPAKPRAKGD